MLELTDLKFQEQNGVSRASARARLVHEPATSGQREVTSEQSWRFVAPIGPIEEQELRWYLESYSLWPIGVFMERAKRTEGQLPQWGLDLYQAVLGTEV
ncbi:MAG: hypothetical protein QF473_36990, partial [Planctomycetota bacterium]|nr:hypothetical protein [Planctomycetota bacterium]